ncbi:hypothetical protein HZS_449 [Henneguya salminicola]|nr:hypothetical protein HZS_449 [Henneguya salminicola]
MGITNIIENLKKYVNLCPLMSRHLITLEPGSNLLSVDYDKIYACKIKEKKETNTYRVFSRIGRLAKDFTIAEAYNVDKEIGCIGNNKKVSVWCSSDYLGMSRHNRVIYAAREAIEKYGVGAGGTRNISGNNILHENLETIVSQWFQKEAALIFTSCFVANSTTLTTLGKLLPNCVFFSDEKNHASIIEGIRNSRCEKYVYKHNDADDLERCLIKVDESRPKIVVFESINSMNGSIAQIKRICDISHKYGAIVFLDEVHAIGLYGTYGSGLSEHQECLDSVDIISGTFGKTVGTIGGFIVGRSNLVDVIRSYAPGLIFTTALPPSIIASSIESIKILQSDEGKHLRMRHQRVVCDVRKCINQLGLTHLHSTSHIIPIIIGDSYLCNKISKFLMDYHNIYVQSINYPTVKTGTERLRIIPTPGHDKQSCENLFKSLIFAFEYVGLKPQPSKCKNDLCKCVHASTDNLRCANNTLKIFL